VRDLFGFARTTKLVRRCVCECEQKNFFFFVLGRVRSASVVSLSPCSWTKAPERRTKKRQKSNESK